MAALIQKAVLLPVISGIFLACVAAVRAGSAVDPPEEASVQEAVYTLGVWRIKPGHEAEFIEAWKALAEVFSQLPRPPVPRASGHPRRAQGGPANRRRNRVHPVYRLESGGAVHEPSIMEMRL